MVEPIARVPLLPSGCQVKRIVQVAIRRACSRSAAAVSPPTDRPMRPIHSRMERPRLTSRLLVRTAWVCK
jgi:hypothetical protein